MNPCRSIPVRRRRRGRRRLRRYRFGYIGYLDQPGEVPRVAVLSDGRGNVFNGKEGDIIEGRYRVLRIGTDSADLIYVDGRGRQTIRLSGQ